MLSRRYVWSIYDASECPSISLWGVVFNNILSPCGGYVWVVTQVLRWESNKMSPEEVAEIREREEDLRTRVIFAREEMKEIRFKRSQSVYLCEEVSRSNLHAV